MDDINVSGSLWLSGAELPRPMKTQSCRPPLGLHHSHLPDWWLSLLPAAGTAGYKLLWQPVRNHLLLQSIKRRVELLPKGATYAEVKQTVIHWPHINLYERRLRVLTVELLTKEYCQNGSGRQTGHYHEWNLHFNQNDQLVSINYQSDGKVWHE